MKKITSARLFLFGALALCAGAVQAATTWYVAPGGNDSAAGTSGAPFKTIQKGVNKAVAGDTVLVAPGTYKTGTQTSSPGSGKSRVKITKDITVRSTHGAAQTFILGQPHSSKQAFGSGSVRCVYMTAGTLDGFTLADGFANARYCTFKKDSPIINGGGVFAPAGNRTPQVNNCIITRCGAYRGGGAYWATLNNCTVVDNYINTASGDGVWGSLVRNSIVFGNGDQNFASAENSVDQTVFEYSCTTPAPGPNKDGMNRDGGNNITNAPLFQYGTYRPATNSPCRNAGNNAYASGPRDASGNARILDGTVDVGAYESTYILYPLTVINGSGSGNYLAGTIVPIAAHPFAAWNTFLGWGGDTDTIADLTAPMTTLIMPAGGITVRALYDVTPLSVTVVSGRDAGSWPNQYHESTGEPEGTYPAGALVRIVANPAPLWQTFDQWEASSPVVFSNRFADVSMFVMPTNDVAITATYRPQNESEKLGGALTIRGQALAVTSYSPSGVVVEATGGIRYNDPVVKMGGPTVKPGQYVSLTTTNFVGSGILYFWWHSDAEKDYDGVEVWVNGVAQPIFCSMKDTTASDASKIWTLSYVRVSGANTIAFRFTRDDTYYIHKNTVLLDRVTWIPQGMVDALGAGTCLPNVNQEYDPLFSGRSLSDGAFTWEGEDGGVAWTRDAPDGSPAIRFGAFGYVTNGALAQVAITNFGTGILTWTWRSRSESGYDFLEFLLNGTRTNWISGKGDNAWHHASYVVANDPGQARDINRGLKRILGFRYRKDSDVSVFEDCGWLRGVGWMPTFSLQLISGTNTAYTLPAPYNTYPGVISEAKKGIFPLGTQVTILADPPQLGQYFDRWTGYGSGVLGAQVTNPNPTFLMPGQDLILTATYTTNSSSEKAWARASRQKSAAAASQSRISGFTMTAPTAKAGAGGLAATLSPMTVVLTFEAAVQTDYEVLFSSALMGLECAWRSLPVIYSEVLGDTADGKRQLRVTVEAPAETPKGFFRIQPR